MRCSVAVALLLTIASLGTSAVNRAQAKPIEPPPVNSMRYPTNFNDFYSWIDSPADNQIPTKPLPKPEIDRLFQQAQAAPITQILPKIRLLKKAMLHYKAIGDQEGLRRVRLEQALIAYRQNQYSDATRLLDPLQQQIRPGHPSFGRLRSLQGLLKLENGELNAARSILLEARGQQGGDFASEQLNTTGLAEVYYRLGQYRRASDLALVLSRNGADRVSQGRAFQILGDINFDLGQLNEAVSYYQNSLEITLRIGAAGGLRNEYTSTNTQIQLGRLYQALGRTSEAKASLDEALIISRRFVDNPRGRILALNAVAALKLETGSDTEFAAALKLLEEAKVMERLTKDVTLQLVTLGNLGQYYTTIDQLDKALETYKIAIQTAEQTGDRAAEAKLRSAEGKVLLKKKDFKSAIQSLEKSTKIFESLRPRLVDAERISIAEQQSRTFAMLQTAQVQAGETTAALVTAERARARAFVELLAMRGVANDRISESSENAPAPTIEMLQETAKQQQATIVTYSIVNDLKQVDREAQLQTWVIQPDGKIQFHAADLTHLSKQWSESVDLTARDSLRQILYRSRPSRASIAIEGIIPIEMDRAASRTLHQLLIEPIQQWLPTNERDRIIFVPQGSLLLVPFAALPDVNGTYLIQKHTLQIAPSIQSLNLLKSNPVQKSFKPLIVGNPSPMPEDLEPLPGSEREAQAIAKLLNTQAITGNNASKSTVLNQISNASLIHLATHGLMDEQSGLESAIILSSTHSNARSLSSDRTDDGRLTASEILNLQLNANLVVLSACNTGRGKITGDGVIGLSRSFMSAGVPSVVVSLWQVPDAPTAALMVDFYAALQKDGDKAQALRQAMLKTMKTYPTPQDWAGFMLVGRSD